MDKYPALIAELTADPLKRGYAGMTDAERLASLAAADRSRPVPMRLSAFNLLLMSRGLLKGIRAGQDGDHPQIASICIGLMVMFQGAADRSVDPTDPATLGMIDALIAAGIAGAADKAAFLAACSVSCSRLEELGLADVGPGHLKSARDKMEAR